MIARVFALSAALLVAGPVRAADVDAAALERLYEYAFTRVGPDADKQGVRTDGVVIVKDGAVVAERYAVTAGFGPDVPHIAWSVSKSALATLIGIAVQQGRLSLDDQLSQYLPQLAPLGNDGPKVRDALEMSSCLQWNETYEGSDFTVSSVLAMLYGRGRADMADFVARRPLDCVPGKTWEYKSGDSVLLSGALKAIYGAAYDDLPWHELFDKLGMTSAVWEQDAAGTFVGSSYLYATPRDFAKLGQLYLQNGVWNGERLLPEDWAAYVQKPVPAIATTNVPADGSAWVGGAHWWSNAPVPQKGLKSTWPAAPADMLVASGHWGQGIFVIPSLGLVIVRTGDDRDGSFDENEFLKLALAAVGFAPASDAAMPKGDGVAKDGPGTSTRRESAYLDIPGLSSAFVAKELCSCLYVMGRSEAQCKVYASQQPMFATYTLDPGAKTVRTALRYASVGGRGLYHREARWRGERLGCTVE